MYLFQLTDTQIKRLYELREAEKKENPKASMAAFVREAVENYLTNKEKTKVRN